MPTPRLATLFLQLFEQALQRASGGRGQGGGPEFFEQGEIISVKGTGELQVSIPGGRTVTGRPTTDEPFRTGQVVWISRTEEGQYIVHGGKR